MKANIKDPIVNILCLSDIHYSHHYEIDNNDLLEYIKSFKNYWVQHPDISIDYILITGDITQEGEEKEFKLFFNHILKPLFKLPNFIKARLLSVPGNHDLNRDVNDRFILKLIKESFLDRKLNRKDFLTKNYKKFLPSFSNYAESMKELADKFPEKVSKNYKNNFFHGYYIDKKNKLFFILLNSAWFSFGEEFLSQYLSKNLINKKGKIAFVKTKKEFYANMKRNGLLEQINVKNEKEFTDKKFFEFLSKFFISIGDEYGKQVLDLEEKVFLEFESMVKDFKKYNDYIFITCQHHDFNFLNFPEGMAPSVSKDKNLNLVKKNTDLLLTGHMHVPIEKNHDRIFEDDILNIPLGSFITFKGENFKYNNNWFSILQISVRKRNVAHLKVSYDVTNKKWGNKVSAGAISFEKKYNTPLNTARKKELIKGVKKLIADGIFLNKYLGETLVPTLKGFYLSVEKEELFLFMQSIDEFTKKELQKRLINKLIKTLDIHTKIDKVCFILVDLFLDKGEYSKDIYLDTDKMAVLNKLKEKVDFNFDLFRHEFFSNLNRNQIIKFSNLSLKCILLPYFEVEYIIND